MTTAPDPVGRSTDAGELSHVRADGTAHMVDVTAKQPTVRQATAQGEVACSPEVIAALTRPRPPVLGLSMDRPRLMGIVNVTPDSFSDGGRWTEDGGVGRARALAAAGAEILDIGGESTRPGAAEVPVPDETARILPVIGAARGLAPISVDTRKAAVAQAAIAAGAGMVNDVSGLDFDPGMAGVVARAGVALCLMHAQGLPETMQDDPRYGDVLLDVYDALAARIARAEAAGVPRARIVVDPGIGFGKTTAHNLALLRRIGLFHGLGVPVLLGVSRKRFIGQIGGGADAGTGGEPGAAGAGTVDRLEQGVQIAPIGTRQMQGRAAQRVLLAIQRGLQLP